MLCSQVRRAENIISGPEKVSSAVTAPRRKGAFEKHVAAMKAARKKG
jgi:hypothetical protein